jgi:hypothetical protein
MRAAGRHMVLQSAAPESGTMIPAEPRKLSRGPGNGRRRACRDQVGGHDQVGSHTIFITVIETLSAGCPRVSENERVRPYRL